MDLDGAVAAVLHPHPSMGGDSSHPFVSAVAAQLSAHGAHVVTPDLRDPDVAQAAPALEALVESTPGAPRVLVGYSWGSVVVSHAAPSGLAARVLVAPPASMALGAAVAEVPVLVLVPEHDQYGDLEATRAAFGSHADATVEVIPNADHFLWGAIEPIATRVGTWLASH